MKRGKKRETAMARRSRERFRDEVLAEGGCYALARIPHVCHSIIDPAHWIPKSFLKAHTSTLAEDEALAIIFDPRNGSPLCRDAHTNIDQMMWEWHLDWVPDEAQQFATEHSIFWKLEERYVGLTRGLVLQRFSFALRRSLRLC